MRFAELLVWLSSFVWILMSHAGAKGQKRRHSEFGPILYCWGLGRRRRAIGKPESHLRFRHVHLNLESARLAGNPEDYCRDPPH